MAKKRPAEDPAEPAVPLNLRAWELIRSTIQGYLDAAGTEIAAELGALQQLASDSIGAEIEAVLESYQGTRRSYRIALISQLAFGIESQTPLDLTKRPPGTRGATGVAGRLGQLLAANHIVSVTDAYQNIAKNTENMVRGNFPEFDSLLTWASDPVRTRSELVAVFNYCCWHIASTARPVLALPEIDQGKLKFAAVMALFESMLQVPSAGAHQQFIAAALLEAKEEQSETGRRVETKNINTSDQSAGTAADVQIKAGTKVDEAFEITANQWSDKLDSAAQKIRVYDLSRLHIVAGVADHVAMLRELATRPDDLSVLELRGFFSTLVAELRRTSRAFALRRLYELLDRHQPNVELVNGYVRLLHAGGLTAARALPDMIRKTPGVLGGDARIGDRRIAVWMLVRARQLGLSDRKIRERYDPPIGVDELEAAWNYYRDHAAEIDEAIRENEDA